MSVSWVADDVSVFREEAEELEQDRPGYLDAWHFPYTRTHDDEFGAEIDAGTKP